MKLCLSILLLILSGAQAQADGSVIFPTAEDHGVERGKVNFNVYENALDFDLKARVNKVVGSRCDLNEVVSLSVSQLVVQGKGSDEVASETMFVFTILIEKSAIDGSLSQQKVQLVLHRENLTGEFRDDFVDEASFSSVCK